MFFRGKLKRTKIRDEWGRVREVTYVDRPQLTDQQLADLLQVDLITVITHRR